MIRKIKTWLFKKWLNKRYGCNRYVNKDYNYKLRKNTLYGSFENDNKIYVDTDSVK